MAAICCYQYTASPTYPLSCRSRNHNTARELVLTLVTNRLDYCNTVLALAALPQCTVEPLQCVQNAAARLILNLGRKEHTTPCLIQLHWLPSSIESSTNCILWCITSGLEELHAISLTSYSPLQLEQHALVCAVPLHRPQATLHLGCIQLLENGHFLFPVWQFGTPFLQTYALFQTMLILKHSWKLISFNWLLTSSSYFIY